LGLGLIVCPKGALGAKRVFFWFFMPGPGPPLLFSVFVFSLPPASSEAPGLVLSERSTPLAPVENVGVVGVLRSQLAAAASAADAAAGMYLVIVVFLAVSGECMHHFLS